MLDTKKDACRVYKHLFKELFEAFLYNRAAAYRKDYDGRKYYKYSLCHIHEKAFRHYVYQIVGSRVKHPQIICKNYAVEENKIFLKVT